ncbi:DUF4129 domain-containing protein [Demequina aurantiaca]|uniref:DUF4129 domain-containing protein n=1 Tax=Demequina aurantiaca TaxID=676200 RepID=UPI000AA5F20F|nr:DUF4129 domain-containing protein [Demequina aurantiaca]
MWASIPVDPDADTAREWAINELAKREYTHTNTNWLEAFWQWLIDLFDGIGRVGSNIGSLGVPGMLIFAVLGLAVVAVIVWIVVGPLRRSRRSRSDAEVFGGDERDSAALSSAADEAAAVGDWTTALVHLYRAMVRHLDERGTIDIYAGMTAHEAAVLAGRAIPPVAVDLATDADAFDDARYGRTATTEADFRHAATTFAEIRATTKRRVANA